MSDTHQSLKSISVGELHVSHAGPLIRTVLGSCIAVCLFDPRARIGGMNHYLLPYGPAGSPTDCRYGEHAIPLLVQRCMAKGAAPDRLVAKIFGGASMQEPRVDAIQRVGEINIAFAVEELADRSIPILGQDVGGRFARDIRFDTMAGSVKVKRILIGTADAAR